MAVCTSYYFTVLPQKCYIFMISVVESMTTPLPRIGYPLDNFSSDSTSSVFPTTELRIPIDHPSVRYCTSNDVTRLQSSVHLLWTRCNLSAFVVNIFLGEEPSP
uniref:Uncharacterized protein n=1 Tax=Parascaris univalens TaxID=6257 RepID=A0A915A8E5_PARUN